MGKTESKFSEQNATNANSNIIINHIDQSINEEFNVLKNISYAIYVIAILIAIKIILSIVKHFKNLWKKKYMARGAIQKI